LVVGFAAETDDVLAHARKKLDAKGCDMIVANDVSPSRGIMGGDKNTIHIVTRDGIDSWPTLDKHEVARRLIARLVRELERE
jgi:phosphopantothenoylcysteine decarboxylase/phosphopantothenate--cysteine ligase